MHREGIRPDVFLVPRAAAGECRCPGVSKPFSGRKGFGGGFARDACGQEPIPFFYGKLLYSRAEVDRADKPLANSILVVPEGITINDG